MQRDRVEMRILYRVTLLDPSQRQLVLNLIQDLGCRIVEANDGCRIDLSLIPMFELQKIIYFIDGVMELPSKEEL
jgi:hypothetical protein